MKPNVPQGMLGRTTCPELKQKTYKNQCDVRSGTQCDQLVIINKGATILSTVPMVKLYADEPTTP